jgi:hypothetical protein
MTAQFSDSVVYRGKDYALAGKSGKGLFDPGEHGMKPVGRCSACWRGFLCSYRVDGKRLVLDQLAVCLDGPAPALFGVEPKVGGDGFPLFDVTYEGLNDTAPYTGGLLLGRGFIKGLYVHMGFHPAWKYREVHELLFENGQLIREGDRSKEIAEFRREVANCPVEPGLGAKRSEDERWIQQCFSQEYRW